MCRCWMYIMDVFPREGRHQEPYVLFSLTGRNRSRPSTDTVGWAGARSRTNAELSHVFRGYAPVYGWVSSGTMTRLRML